MGLLFDTLEKYQKNPGFGSSEEMSFYTSNRVVLESLSQYSRFMRVEDPFDVIRANIIIRAIINKRSIEVAYANKSRQIQNGDLSGLSIEEHMANITAELPFAKSEKGNTKIYVPIFPYNLNTIYDGRYELMLEAPYMSMLRNFEAIAIDPFDYYGPAIFDSYFTKLVMIKRVGEHRAFYDYDSESIYFVDPQGRLDAKICLFDRYIKRPDHNHMLSRIVPVVESYYAQDRNELERVLVDNKLISSRLIFQIQAKRAKIKQKVFR